jgi:hypothetical protein
MTLLLHFPLWNTSCCLPSKLPYSNLPPSGVSITKDLVVALKAPVMVVSLVIEILSSFSILNGVLVWVVNDMVPVAPEEPKVIFVLPCNTVTPPILYELACAVPPIVAAPPIVNVEVLLPLILPEAVIFPVNVASLFPSSRKAAEAPEPS